MTPASRSDEELDRLLARRDPVDRARLSHPDLAAVLVQLEAAVAHPAPQRKRRRRPRPRLALSGALIGAMAAGLIVATALLPSNGVHGGQLGPAPATAAAMALDRAARTAIRRPELYPTARQYQYLAVETGSVSGYGRGASNAPPGDVLWGINIWQSETKRDWFKPNGSGRELILDTGRGFLTPHDRAVALAHHTSLSSMMPNQSVDGIYPAGGIGWGYLTPAGLPTRGVLQAVERKMRSKSMGHRPAAADVFSTIGELLFESNSPTQRASLYQALAELPGVRFLGHMRDRLGRSGLAVEIVRPGSHGVPATASELIFDPATSEVLQSENVLLGAYRWGANGPTMAAGTVQGYTVFLARGIVNSISELPGGGRLPYHPSIGAGTR